MILAQVTGTVVATNRADGIPDARYLVVEQCDHHGTGTAQYHVALDMVGADRGEVVIVSQGSASRQHAYTNDRPVDAVIVGIVDTIDRANTVTYSKQGPVNGLT